jgi:predicted ABC-type exoprotein transport system permease subunit
MRSSRRFRRASLRLRARIAQFFGYSFFIVIAVAAILVAIADTFFTLPLFKGATPFVTAFVVAALLIYIVQERASVLDDMQERLESSGVKYITNQQALYIASAQVMIETSVNPRVSKSAFVR